MKKYSLLTLVLFSLFIVSCSEDYLETAPTNSITEKDMLSSLTGAETVMDGINRSTYYFGGAHDLFGQKSIDYALDCVGDDFYPTERGYGWFLAWYQWKEHRNVNSTALEYVWSYYYDIANNANLIIGNIEPMTFETVAETNKQKSLLAQAYTYRAFSFYNLVQLFAEGTKGIPLPLVANSEPLARSSVDDVYTRIFADLEKAETLFSEGGNSVKRKNVSQINVHVNYAIHARAALTRGTILNDNALLQDARDYANLVIAEFPLSEDYMYGWNKANEEWVWGAVLIDEQQTSYASFFSHMDPFFGGYCTLGNHHIMPTALFDYLPNNDARKLLHMPQELLGTSYFNNYFGKKARSSFKYTGWGEWTNDYLYIKSGEMYLISAEASARLNEDVPAQNAINALNAARTVGGAYTHITLTGVDLLDAILMYRRAELWGDGQRFFDMKRLRIGNEGRTIEQEMRENTNGIPAGDPRFTFLIPQQEINANPLMEQNTL